MLTAAHHDFQRAAPWRRDRSLACEQLRVTEYRVQRRAQLVTDSRQITALGKVRRFGDFLRALQLCGSLLVRCDLLMQELVLTQRLFPRDAAAFLRQHEQPPGHSSDQPPEQKNLTQRNLHVRVERIATERFLKIYEPDDGGDQAGR